MTTFYDRFLDKVSPEPNSGCHLWMGSISGGYGTMFKDGRIQKAHRISYEMKYGPIPEGMELDHLCRVTSCVNPQHLQAVSHRENMARGPWTFQRSKTHCPSGHKYSENTYHRPNRNGGVWRVCLACKRIYDAKRWAEKRMTQRIGVPAQ